MGKSSSAEKLVLVSSWMMQHRLDTDPIVTHQRRCGSSLTADSDAFRVPSSRISWTLAQENDRCVPPWPHYKRKVVEFLRTPWPIRNEMRVTRASGAYVALTTHARQPEIVADSTCSQAARTMRPRSRGLEPYFLILENLHCGIVGWIKIRQKRIDSWIHAGGTIIRKRVKCDRLDWKN